MRNTAFKVLLVKIQTQKNLIHNLTRLMMKALVMCSMKQQMIRFKDLSRIEKAAEQGGANEVIASLSDGYETQLGRWFEGGAELSAGQWQKLAVSRAFMWDAEVLILDEPTASLDAEAEYELFQRFQTLTEGKISILISHRFSTVRMADRILVLREGKVEEFGYSADLLAGRAGVRKF